MRKLKKLRDRKTKLISFRVSDRIDAKLADKAGNGESKSQLMRRIVDEFVAPDTEE